MKYAYMALAGFLVVPCIRNCPVRIYMLDSMRTINTSIYDTGPCASAPEMIIIYNYCTIIIIYSTTTIYNLHSINLPTPVDTAEMTSTLLYA